MFPVFYEETWAYGITTYACVYLSAVKDFEPFEGFYLNYVWT
jgi:hypothetical protein